MVDTPQQTPAERAVDRERLADIAARLLDLERSLRTLSAEKELLETEEDLLQDRLDAYTYPVLTLPPEVVSEIFVHCLPVYPRRAPDNGLYSPVALTHICRLWRRIALSTPSLWRTFKIILRTNDSGRADDANQVRVAEWLRRSGSCALSVELEYLRREPPLIFQTIMAHRHRWQHLKLFPSMPNFPAIIGPFPLLRTLTLTTWLLTPEHAMYRSPAFRYAPLLRRVAIDSYEEVFRDMLPWSQLTVLVIHDIEGKQCLAILALAPRLVYCDLAIGSVGEGDAPSHALLDQLKTLKIRSSIYSSHSTVLSALALQLPALRRLHIDEMYLMPDRVVALRALLMRWNCTPQEIRIARPQQPLHAYSEALPSILISSTHRPRVTIRFLDPQPTTIVGLEAANILEDEWDSGSENNSDSDLDEEEDSDTDSE
ncbi:hypothetical protein C8R46DRAFT_1076023 [Mycena filopes]|nr:hypothetical protein C8R46DRAFT_1076023 [Mycena filopes]